MHIPITNSDSFVDLLGLCRLVITLFHIVNMPRESMTAACANNRKPFQPLLVIVYNPEITK